MAEDKGYFNKVAKRNKKDNINSNINNDTKKNVSINPDVKFEKEIEDPLEKLSQTNPAKELTTVMKGIYFDSEVWEVIEEQAKKLGRGGKSNLVNEVMKKYFQDKGLL